MPINVKFPFEDSTDKNLFKLNTKSKDAIISNILLYLETRKGERFYNPNFGTNLLRFIFEPNDAITDDDIRTSLKQDLESQFNNLNVTQIDIVDGDVTNNDLVEHVKIFRMEFSYNSSTFNFEELIEIVFPL